MSAVNSVNPGVADLIKTLLNSGSAAVSTTLSSPAVQSAVKNASTADVVQLGRQALQLQTTSSLFSSFYTPPQSTDPGTLLLQALNSSETGSTTPASTPAVSTTTTPTQAVASSALQQAYSLFGGTTGAGAPNTSISFVG
jgi:hypothetical protein